MKQPSNLRKQIEDQVGEAYEIGYAHGGNPYRKPYQKVNIE